MIAKFRQLLAVQRQLAPMLRSVPGWLARSREFTNFTYHYTEAGLAVAVETVALITGLPIAYVTTLASELLEDQEFRAQLERQLRFGAYASAADPQVRYGRRIVQYLLARATRPRFVVEAGTDRGLGACVIALALRRNAAEGYPGRLLALDIREDRGLLLGDGYGDVASLRIGDSVEYLRQSSERIDLFIHDTTPDAAHEVDQFSVLATRLSPRGLVTSSWYTPEFLALAKRTNRRLLVLPEFPSDHWYPGSRLPIAFPWPAGDPHSRDVARIID